MKTEFLNGRVVHHLKDNVGKRKAYGHSDVIECKYCKKVK